MATLGGNVVQIVIQGVDKTGPAAKTATSNLDKIGALAVKAAAGLATLGSIRALTSLGQEAIDTADQMGKLAQQAGVTTEFMSALTYNAGLNEVATEGVKRGMKELNQALVQNDVAFRAIGVATRDSDGALRSVESILPQVADRFADMADGAQKSEIATRLFGKAGIDLIPMLNQGSKGLRDATEEAKRFGLIVDSQAAKAADEFNDNLAKLQSMTKGAAMELTQQMLPALTAVTSAMVEWAKENEVATKAGGLFRYSVALGIASLDTLQKGLNKISGSQSQTIIDIIKRQKTESPEQGPPPPPGFEFGGMSNSTKQKHKDEYAELQSELEIANLEGSEKLIAIADREHLEMIARIEETTLARKEALGERYLAESEHVQEVMRLNSEAHQLMEMEKTRHMQTIARVQEDESKRLLMTYSKNFNTMGDVFGNFASLAQAIGKKNNAAFKALMYVQAVVSTAAGITRALAEHAWPYSLVIAASIAAAGAAQIAVISQAGSSAHGGMTYVPNESSYQLAAGERVLSPKQNEDFTEFLSKGSTGSGQSMTVNVYLDGDVLARGIGDMSRDGRLEISARAVR